MAASDVVMENPQSTQNPPPMPVVLTPKRRRFWRRPWVWVLLVLAGVLLGVWSTGIVQHAALLYGLKAAIKGEVELGPVSLWGHLKVSDVRVFKDGGARSAGAYTVRLSGVDINHRLIPFGGRFVPSVEVGSVDVRLNGVDKANTNYDFLFAELGRDVSGAGESENAGQGGLDPRLLWVAPRETRLKCLAVEGRFSDSGFNVKGPSFEGRLDDFTHYQAVLRGEPFEMRWWTGDEKHALSIPDARMEIGILRDGAVYAADPVRLMAGGRFSIDGQVRFDGEGGDLDASFSAFLINDFEARSYGLDWPLRFAKADLSGSRLRGVLEDDAFRCSEASVHGAVEGLVAGGDGGEKPWYEGGLSVEGHSEGERLAGAVTLSRGQRLTVSGAGGRRTGQAEFAIEGWSREDVLGASAPGIRKRIEALGALQRFNASGEVYWGDDVWKASGWMTPLFRDVMGEESVLETKVSASGPLSDEGGNVVTAALSMSMGRQTATVGLRMGPEDQYEAKVHVNEVEPHVFWRTVSGTDALLDWRASLSGDVSLTPLAGTRDLAFEAKLSSAPFRYKGVGTNDGEEARLTGSGVIRRGDGDRLEEGRFDVAMGADDAVRLRKLTLSLDSYVLDTDLEAVFALERLAEPLGYADLHGEVEAKGHVRRTKDQVVATLEGVAETLGYGDMSMPYGVTTAAAGKITYSGDTKVYEGTGWVISAGDGTQIEAKQWSFRADPLLVDAGFTVKSDLGLLVKAGYLGEVSGRIEGEGRAYVESDEPRVEAKGRLNLMSVALPKGWGEVSGVTGDWQFGWAGETGVSADLEARSALIGGARLGGLRGRIALAREVIRATGIEGTLFDGSVRIDGELSPFDAGRPMRLHAQVHEMDLAVFTREVHPADIQLAGRATGYAEVSFRNGELTGLDVWLRAGKGLSVDRETVRRVLMTQYAGQVTGGRQVEKTIDDVIGPGAQRSFDKAELKLGLKDGRIVGQAQCTSGNLNVTVDILSDVEALYDALEIRGQAGR